MEGKTLKTKTLKAKIDALTDEENSLFKVLKDVLLFNGLLHIVNSELKFNTKLIDQTNNMINKSKSLGNEPDKSLYDNLKNIMKS